MKKTVVSSMKCIAFFLGWAVLVSALPLPASENPAVWRLWAELMPLLAIAAFTFVFWLVEKRTVALHLVDNLARGICLGTAAGILWLAIPVAAMIFMDIIALDGRNSVPSLALWVLAAFLNVIMQELLVRGYLYQMLKQQHNTIAAVVVTTALFTFLHGGAFEAGLVPVLNVVSMSLLMTIALEYGGSLIVPIIMHFVWNGIGALALGGVSLAEDYPHLLNLTFSGNDILSGGAYKIEGSVIVLLVNIIGIAVFYVRNRSKT